MSKKEFMQDRCTYILFKSYSTAKDILHRSSTTASIKTEKKLQTTHFCRLFLLELPGRWSSLGGNLENWRVYAAE
jgi:hypothetical protein